MKKYICSVITLSVVSLSSIAVNAEINFNNSQPGSYGGSAQDIIGRVQVEDGGSTLSLQGNRWQKIDFAYTLTPETVLEFDFQSENQGEIHAVGFDTDLNLNENQTFRLYGTQPWGNSDFSTYPGNGMVHYVIPVGRYHTGQITNLFFVNDQDIDNPTASSSFSHVKVHEGNRAAIDFGEFPLSSYGGSQDGSGTVRRENQKTLYLDGNRWQKIDFPLTITSDTILAFDFQSDGEGELHAIAFDDDLHPDKDRTFQLYGTQTWWGVQDYHTYTPSGKVHYEIPVGHYYTGDFKYLVFVNDQDNPTAGILNNSRFSNVEITTNSNAITNYSVSWESNFSLPTQDADGWSILTPSSDSRIIYVSESDGNDNNALIYSPGDSAIGDDVYHPTGSIKPYRSIATALSQMRKGYPDYLLLKKGDIWRYEDTIEIVEGASPSERSVIASYGSAPAQPKILTGTSSALLFWYNKSINSAVIGLHFVAQKRIPAGSEFVSFGNTENPRGFVITGHGVMAILIEGCTFEWYANNVVAAVGEKERKKDIIFRRNVISHSYSEKGHSQGFFSSKASILLEENIFDHNGWYQQGDGGTKAGGRATMFNHNIYFEGSHNTIVRKNIFLRPSSMNTKFTSNSYESTDQIHAKNILVDNNVFIDGEIGISLGGNADNHNGYRWENILVINNVIDHMNQSLPTNRGLAWGIGIQDWNGGRVAGNILTSYGGGDVTNVSGFRISGFLRNVSIDNNIAYNVAPHSSKSYATFIATITDGERGAIPVKQNVNITNNHFILPDTSSDTGNLLDLSVSSQTGITFDRNTYYSAYMNTVKEFQISGNRYTFEDWISNINEKTYSNVIPDYIDADRNIETYIRSIGISGGIAAFADQATKRSKDNWNYNYTADAILNYIWGGFCTTSEDCPYL